VSLADVTIVIGAASCVLMLGCLAFPQAARAGLDRLPRNRWLGYALVILDLAWVAYEVQHLPLGNLEGLKEYLPYLTPLAILLVAFFMDELLAARAFGGLLLLLPIPVLDAAFLHPSPWRLVLVAVAYAWAVAGMVIVLAPYRLRQLLHLFGEGRALRLRATAGFAVGVGFCILGLTQF
jgi:hypothetical protein